MGTANRVAKNTLILYARMGITMFISLYVTRLVLAALGVSDFGIFNVVGGAVAMLTFLNNAMATATQRFMSYSHGEGDEEKQKRIFNASVVLHLLVGTAIAIIMEGVGYFFFNGILNIAPDRMSVAKLIYHFLVVSTFVKVISVPYDAVINARENMLFVAILGIFESLLKLAIALYITYTGLDKLASYGLLMAAMAIVLLLITRVYCHRKYAEVTINFKKYYDKKLLKEMTGFAGWTFLGASSSMFSFYGQGIVLNMFFGTIVNAAQGVANQISGQLGVFANTMLKALNPIIAKSEGAGNRDYMIKATLSGSKMSVFLLILFYIPVLIEMPYLFKIWLKEIPDYTIIFCRLLLIKNLIDQLFITLNTSISAVGGIKKFQIHRSILNIAPLLATLILFKMGGQPQLIYFAFMFFSVANGINTLYFSKKNFGLSINTFLKEVILKIALTSFFAFIVGLIPYLNMEEGVLRLFIITALSALTLILSFWKFALDKYEKQIILLAISKFKESRKRNFK